MILAGNDPSGGAGIAADIETLVSLGCHPAPVITALTVQDTHDVHNLLPVESALVLAQARAVLADLPGYGYAAVPLADRVRWQRVMANYLVSRRNLAGIVMLADPRHGLKELDELLLEVIRPRVEQGLPFLILLTKADKLNRSEQAKALQITRLQAGGGAVMLFSAPKRQGVEDAATWLRAVVDAAASPSDAA